MTRWKEWSDDEKSLLMSCRYAKPPIEWAVIQADVFPDRTKASLRQQWYKLQRELGDLRPEKRQKLGPTDRYPPNRRSGVHRSVDVGVVTDHDESYSSESEDGEDTDHEMGVEMVSDCETESDNDFGNVYEDGVMKMSGPMSIVKQEPSTPDPFIPVAEAPKQTAIINPSRPIDNRENESPSPESPNLQGINLHTGNEVHKTGPLNVLGILQQVHQEAAVEHLKLQDRIKKLKNELRMAEEQADQLLECKTKADVLRKKVEQPDSFMPSDFRNLSALLELGHGYGKLTADNVVQEQ
ncbi:hypothetical protein BDV18DRAFT_155923 [Aspergillus unguis]